MEVQAYCMVNPDNLCDNVCMWDGNPDTWQPPAGYTMLVQATTPAMVWSWNGADWVLVEQVGTGGIGFTWNGVYLLQPKPDPSTQDIASNQPLTTGTQTL